MPVYKLVESCFVEVEDPLGDGLGDMASLYSAAGYISEASTAGDEDVGAGVTLYCRPAAPRYYIDLMGINAQIAAVVADDFPALVRTMKELHPLLTLIGLDQATTTRVLKDISADRSGR